MSKFGLKWDPKNLPTVPSMDMRYRPKLAVERPSILGPTATSCFPKSGGKIHCLRCRSKTSSHNMHGGHTVHGRRMIKGNCGQCGGNVSRFVRHGDGLWDYVNQGINTFDSVLPSLVNKVIPGAGSAGQNLRGQLFGRGILDTLKKVGKVASLALPGGYYIRGAIGDGVKKGRKRK
jgi:hypothetical protein